MDFGERLKTAIGSFTVDFLPHMREEEEVCVCVCVRGGGYSVCINGRILLRNRNRTVEMHRPGGKEKIREGQAVCCMCAHCIVH